MTTPGLGRSLRDRGARNGLVSLDGRLRVAFVLFGGMLALQSSKTLDATKIVYLVGTILCLGGAMLAVWRARGTPAVRHGAPWLAASTALVILIAMSLLVARANGTPITDWLRDVAAYGLLASVPIFALDAQRSSSRRVLIGLLVVAGLLGGLSWAVEWLDRRDIVDLPFSRLVFPSGQLPSVLYLFAMATALTVGSQRTVWVLLAGVVLGLFLLTGTRSSLLLLIGPIAMVAIAGGERIQSSVRTVFMHGVVAVAVVLAFQLALALPILLEIDQSGEPGASHPAATLGPSVAGSRIGTLPGVLGNPASDPSFRERVSQYEAAWVLFVSSPIVGVGPGHSIDWVNVSGRPRTGFTADTPLVLPAKFGLLGILVLMGTAAAYGNTVRTALRRSRRSAITLTLVGYGALTLAIIPLGFPFEDKGGSLALILLLTLTFAELHTDADPIPSATLRS